jgi:hypothetical protein
MIKSSALPTAIHLLCRRPRAVIMLLQELNSGAPLRVGEFVKVYRRVALRWHTI